MKRKKKLKQIQKDCSVERERGIQKNEGIETEREAEQQRAVVVKELRESERENPWGVSADTLNDHSDGEAD